MTNLLIKKRRNEMKYGKCETFGKSSLLRQLQEKFQRKQGFITIGVDLDGCDSSAEEM